MLNLASSGEVAREEDAARRSLDADELDFGLQKREQEIRELRQSLDERHEEHELRKKFLHMVYFFVVSVVCCALLLTVFCAAGVLHLSDAVLITVLTTTIANVIGCLLIAFKWLFPSK